ncbi:MAG: CHASE domain-containing protein [Gammaproteobacteria bacterium]|nr:CHASE domain-containing protein [Gammaproteobacteria bacterium]
MAHRIPLQFNWIIQLSVFFAGLVLSYLGYYVALSLESHTVQVEQQRITTRVKDALDKELENSLGILSSIRGLFLASNDVSRDEFFLFTESKLKAHHSIKALEWIPQITEVQREEYRQQAVRDGLADFDIRERDPEGKLIPAQQRDEYFPVYYVEPLKGNEAAVGFDLASSQKRLVSLQQARLTQQPQVTASISLVQESEDQKGFLVFQPIFMPAARSTDQDEVIFNGFALGVFRMGDLFESAITPIQKLLEPLLIELTDITDKHNTDLLHRKDVLTDTKLLTDSAWRVNQDIQFANRTWKLSTHATQAFIKQYSDITHWMVLAAGIILTLLITGFLHILMRRESEIRQLVAQRTKALHASEKMSRLILEAAVDAVITINDKGIVSLFNPAAERIFGYSSEEVTGQNVKMLMPDPYHSEHDGYLSHYLRTGERRIIGFAREVTGQRKDGCHFPIHLSVGEAQVNGRTLFVGTITDLTKIKKNEQEMREFNERLDLATRAGGIGVWDLNISNGELNWDAQMFRLYGVTQEQFQGAFEAWHNALHPDDLKRAKAELQAAIQGGKTFDTEFRIIWPDGQERYIKASAVVVFDDKNQGQRMIGVNLDITESKRLEETMRQAKLAAEKANQQKSAFLNVMSHELRTPLTVILGYLPLLKNPQQKLSIEAIAQIAEDMDISGHHLMELINDLLDISKIEAGQMTLFREEARSEALINEMVRKFDNQAQQKDIQLLSDVQDFSFNVDTRRLRQILINLIGNALKFTQQGNITISASRTNNDVTFSVADTGIGIPAAELPFVFDTFRQVDDSSTRNTNGSGLGLAITRRLVELHGGTINIESKPGTGTVFTFTINQGKVDG